MSSQSGSKAGKSDRLKLVTLLGAVICSVIAVAALFLPLVTSNDDSKTNNMYVQGGSNAFKDSYLDEDSRNIIENIDASIDNPYLASSYIDYAKKTKQLIIASTVAVFSMIMSAVFVSLGKSSGKKILAIIMAFVGLGAAGFLLVSVFMFTGAYNDHTGEKVVSAGIGPIIMTVASLCTLVFTCIGKNE